MTPKRPRRHVENDEYSAFVRRILRAYSRRAGDGDVEALALMLGLAEEIDAATAEAVKDLRDCGYSWAEIGSQLGITRQAAQQCGRHPSRCAIPADHGHLGSGSWATVCVDERGAAF